MTAATGSLGNTKILECPILFRNECFSVKERIYIWLQKHNKIPISFFFLSFFGFYFALKTCSLLFNLYIKKKKNQNCSRETCQRAHFPPLYYFFSDHRWCSIQPYVGKSNPTDERLFSVLPPFSDLFFTLPASIAQVTTSVMEREELRS